RRLGDVLEDLEWPQFEEARDTILPGAIAIWGDLCVHRDGCRASHACIVALAWSPDMPTEVVKLARAVAHSYNVPLVAVDELEAEASRCGTPLTDDVGPEPARPGAYVTSSSSAVSAALAWYTPSLTYATSVVA